MGEIIDIDSEWKSTPQNPQNAVVNSLNIHNNLIIGLNLKSFLKI